MGVTDFRWTDGLTSWFSASGDELVAIVCAQPVVTERLGQAALMLDREDLLHEWAVDGPGGRGPIAGATKMTLRGDPTNFGLLLFMRAYGVTGNSVSAFFDPATELDPFDPEPPVLAGLPLEPRRLQ